MIPRMHAAVEQANARDVWLLVLGHAISLGAGGPLNPLILAIMLHSAYEV